MELKMAYDKQGRYYYFENGPKMYSVSTVLNWGKPKGRTSDMAKIGTIAHYHVWKQLTEEKMDRPTEVPHWMSIREANEKIEDVLMMWGQLELEKIVKKWIAIEEAVYWTGEIDGIKCWYAGRLDGIADCFDDIVRMTDLKCGDEYEYYGQQVAAYIQAYEQMYPEVYIGEAWNIYCDVGCNYVKETNTTYDRNPRRVPRIKVWNREEIDREMVIFNNKLKKIFEEFQ